MKKLLIVLFSALMLAGCANDPYKIDHGATANAPWKVGEIVYFDDFINRKFIGITQDGYYMVQDFYIVHGNDNNKGSDPWIIMNQPGVNHEEPILPHGRMVFYNPNGGIRSNCSYKQGTLESPPCLYLDENNNIEFEETVSSYENGILSNEVTHYADSLPTMMVQMNYDYKTEVEDMVVTRYSSSGQRAEQGQERNGQRYGIFRVWDENGNLIEETDYGLPQN